MTERSLTDRVLSLYERAQDEGTAPPTVSAALLLAEENHALHQEVDHLRVVVNQRLRALEEVVYRGRSVPIRRMPPQEENPT